VRFLPQVAGRKVWDIGENILLFVSLNIIYCKLSACRWESNGCGVELGRGQYRSCHRDDSDGECAVSAWSRRHSEHQEQMGDASVRRLLIEAAVLSGQEQHVSCGRSEGLKQRQLHVFLWLGVLGACRLLCRLPKHLLTSVKYYVCVWSVCVGGGEIKFRKRC